MRSRNEMEADRQKAFRQVKVNRLAHTAGGTYNWICDVGGALVYTHQPIPGRVLGEVHRDDPNKGYTG